MQKLTLTAAALALVLASGGAAPALAAPAPAYDFAPLAVQHVTYSDTDGNSSDAASARSGVTLSQASVWGWRAPGTALTATLLDASGRTVRSLDEHVWLRTRSSFVVSAAFGDLCTGGYIIRVAVAGDPSRFEERAFAVPSGSTAGCMTADAPSAAVRPMVVLTAASSAAFVDEEQQVRLPFWATRYDAAGTGQHDRDGRPATTEKATLVVESSTGEVRRFAGVALQSDSRPALRLPLGSYRYWLETTASDGTVLRSNSLTVGVYRIAVQRTLSGRTVVRDRGRIAKRVDVRLAASLPAPPPAFLHAESDAARRLTACIRLHGDTGLVQQRCASPRWTGAMTVRTRLTVDGRVRGAFRAGHYQVETDTGMADAQQVSDAEVERYASIRAVDRR